MDTQSVRPSRTSVRLGDIVDRPRALEPGVASADRDARRAVTLALATDAEAAGGVVVPVRDAHLVVRSLPLPAGAIDVPVEPLHQGALPAVLACAALMLWIAVRRAQ